MISGQRVSSFLRSLLPADRKQLVLLAGGCSLQLSEALRWWPAYDRKVVVEVLRMPTFLGVALDQWIYFTKIASLSAFCAGAVAYFVCFWPGPRPARRLFYGSIFPGGCGILAVCIGSLVRVSHQAAQHAPIPESNASSLDVGFHSFPRLAWDLGPGFRFAVAGLLLVSFAAIESRRKRLDLPLRLTLDVSQPQSSPHRDDPEFNRIQRFIWFCLALLPIAIGLFTLPVFLPLLLLPVLRGHGLSPIPLSQWQYGLQSFLTALPLPLAAFWAMGPERRDFLRRALRIPPRIETGLAVFFAIAGFALPQVCAFAIGRIRAVSFWENYLLPPGSFLGFPAMRVEFLLFLALPLLAEIAWRGYLQSQLVARYGVFRGLFLVGIVWGIAHYGVFPELIWADVGVVLRFIGGIIWGLAYAFVLGWLTLRCGSVLPAAVAAGLVDVLLRATLYDANAVLRPETVRVAGIAIWSVIAFVLFRYWPI